MELIDGYKRTETGIIPEDWDYLCLDKISDIKTGPFGSALHAKDYVDIGTPIITVEHLGEFSVIHRNLPKVSDYDKRRLNSYVLRVNDIVFSRVGSVDRNSLITSREDGWLFSGRLLRIRPEHGKVHSGYLSFYFHYEPVKQLIRNKAVGQTMASLNTKLLASLYAVLPSLPEQQTIAETLSDVDDLISSLTKLIIKKKDIKLGAMYELLTGKKRLEGFIGERSEKNLGEVVDFLKGSGLSKSKLSIKGRHKCLLYGELFTRYSEVINSVYSLTNYKEGMVSNKGDVLMPGSTTTAGIDLAIASSLNLGDVLIGGDVNILRPKVELNSEFLARYLSCVKKTEISQATQGITIIHLYAKNLSDMLIELPCIEEQTAIANILSDMDTEIEALEQKLNKYKAIKQGMMQELLTGRIRLI